MHSSDTHQWSTISHWTTGKCKKGWEPRSDRTFQLHQKVTRVLHHNKAKIILLQGEDNFSSLYILFDLPKWSFFSLPPQPLKSTVLTQIIHKYRLQRLHVCSPAPQNKAMAISNAPQVIILQQIQMLFSIYS